MARRTWRLLTCRVSADLCSDIAWLGIDCRVKTAHRQALQPIQKACAFCQTREAVAERDGR